MRFHEMFSMPGVLGCIDCSQVAIARPKENEERFYCRKQYHSLNVQLFCNADLDFLSVDASYAGGSHSFIWANHPNPIYGGDQLQRRCLVSWGFWICPKEMHDDSYH